LGVPMFPRDQAFGGVPAAAPSFSKPAIASM
jgi:hypothetical protein